MTYVNRSPVRWLIALFLVTALGVNAMAQESDTAGGEQDAAVESPAPEPPAPEPPAPEVTEASDVTELDGTADAASEEAADDGQADESAQASDANESEVAEEPVSAGGAGHEDADHEHGDAGHGHEDADHGHGDGHGANTNPMSIKPDLAIFTAIVFLLLLFILGKFAWGPIMAGLDQRERSIADQIDEAAANAEKASLRLQEYEEKLALATTEAQEVLAKAQKDAEAMKERIVSEAKETAARERERAVADITTAKNAALTEIAQSSVDSAVGLASKIVRREVKSDDHSQLISDALERFPSQN